MTFFTLGSTPPDKKTPLVVMNSPVRETPTDLQVIIANMIHVSVDSVLVKKRKHQNRLRSRKS